MNANDKTAQDRAARIQEFVAANIPFLAPDDGIMRDHRMAPRSEREERMLKDGGNEYLFDEIRRFLQGALDDNFEEF